MASVPAGIRTPYNTSLRHYINLLINILMNCGLKKYYTRVWLDSALSVHGPVARSTGHGNELSGSVAGEISDSWVPGSFSELQRNAV
jgi:hypothetical protein